MRILSGILYIIAGLLSCLWAFGYLYISGLACAFGNPNGNCTIKFPWQLVSEDFVFMFLIPFLIICFFFGLAFLIGKAAKK